MTDSDKKTLFINDIEVEFDKENKPLVQCPLKLA